MEIGVGFSDQKDLAEALGEALKRSHQDLKALQADAYFVVYTYDHALDAELFSSLLQRHFRAKSVWGCSTWSAWTRSQAMEGEAGVFVLAFRGQASAPLSLLKVHSLKEKQGLWASELHRQLQGQVGTLLYWADALAFQAGSNSRKLQQSFPEIPVVGMGASYGIPQCSVIVEGQVYSNALVGAYWENVKALCVGIQGVQAELEPIRINRMSENLIIEIDEKPAFYRLCEHLVEVEDLPMMPQDEFRKHMGNLFLVETESTPHNSPHFLGRYQRSVALLGSEMTTGMVAVSEPVDLSRAHYLGQKKPSYFEENAERYLAELKAKLPDPAFIWAFVSQSQGGDREEQASSLEFINRYFPGTPVFGMSSHFELAWELNQHSMMLVAFPKS